MKKQNERIEQLRSMDYTDYLATPDWQRTRKAALQRAGKQCQGCQTGDVELEVYHTTLDSLGCEQADDIMVLCATCYDRLLQLGKLAGQDGMLEDVGEEQQYPHISLWARTKIFGVSSLATVGLPLFLHAPLPAEVFGVAAAIGLAVKCPEIYAQVKGELPAGLVEWLDRQAERKRERVAKREWN